MGEIKNINSEGYWNERFSSKSWSVAGRSQTEAYAQANVNQMPLDSNFEGTILDFGCALGDAIPIYADAYPKAKFHGIDISPVAIEECNQKYGKIAKFSCGDHKDVVFADVIVASHVMEHITGDREVVRALLTKCKELFIIVPYKESPLFIEHVNYYDEQYYSEFEPEEASVFTVCYRRRFEWKIALKNLLLFRSKPNRDVRKEMVLFHMKGNC